MNYSIPFNSPYSAPRALEFVGQALDCGKLSGNGPYGQQCCRWLEQETGCQRAFLTPSCTSALEMSAVLANLQPDEEVIIPSFTFVSTANAFALLGLRPVFVDVRPDTLNLDPSGLAAALTPRTRAIVPVHYAGVACPMDEILEFARKHGLLVIEDNAHGLTGRYGDRPLGSLGDLATQSFHETKNFSCGEGGALLVNRTDWIERAHIVQDKGTNRARFLLGLVDKYTWVDKGSSYLLGELPAALLMANFQQRDWIFARRQVIWARYHACLAEWSVENGVRQPILPAGVTHPAHLYYLLMPSQEIRQRLISQLKDHGILAVFHYQPLHLGPMGIRYGARPGQCPVAEDVAPRLVRLPLYADLSDEQQARVIEAIVKFKV